MTPLKCGRLLLLWTSPLLIFLNSLLEACISQLIADPAAGNPRGSDGHALDRAGLGYSKAHKRQQVCMRAGWLIQTQSKRLDLLATGKHCWNVDCKADKALALN